MLTQDLRMLTDNTYSWQNRVKYALKLYDMDANGVLSRQDFESLAIKNTIVEMKGKWIDAKFDKSTEATDDQWNDLAKVADSDKDGEVTINEYKKAIQNSCTGKAYADFPKAFTATIEGLFSAADVDWDGAVGIEEFRLDCVNRNWNSYRTVDELNNAYEKLLTEDDKKKGGITLKRYQDLYAQFMGNPDESNPAVYLFGPLKSLE